MAWHGRRGIYYRLCRYFLEKANKAHATAACLGGRATAPPCCVRESVVLRDEMPLTTPFDADLAKGFLFGVLSGDTFDKYALGNVQAS